MKINVRVKPNSKEQKIEEIADGSWLVFLKSSPIEGKANQELIKLLAKRFQVTQNDISIKIGINSRNKVVAINKNSVK